MNERLNQPGAPETAGHGAPGVEPVVGSAAMRNIVIRHPDGSQISSLDTNHDGKVTMREINPPRPENGHDLIHTAAGGAVMIGAALLVASAVSIGQRLGLRR